MASPQNLSSVNCEVRIIRAKNIELKSNESLFVRFYLSAGNNKRVRVDSQEISAKPHLFWNQSFSLECFGNKLDSMIDNNLIQSSVVFELRRRIRIPGFGKISRSNLLGRAEIPWKTVFESKGMEIEEWVFMNVNEEGVKPPAIQVAIKLVDQVPIVKEEAEGRRRRRRAAEGGEERGCVDGGWNYADYDVFALEATLVAF